MTRNQKRREILLSAVILFSISVLFNSPNTYAANTNSHHELIEFLERDYFEGIQYQKAKKFDRSNLATLREILNNPAQKNIWSNAAGVTGIIGGPEASKILIQFIERYRNSIVDNTEFQSSLSAIVALGYSANGAEPVAHEFLVKAVRRYAYGLEPSTTSELVLSDQIIGQQSLQSLGLSAQQKSHELLQILTEEKFHGTRENFSVEVETAMKIWESVSDHGLEVYLDRQY